MQQLEDGDTIQVELWMDGGGTDYTFLDVYRDNKAKEAALAETLS